MSEETTTPTAEATSGPRPTFRAWIVQDGPDGKPVWTELSGLWPAKSGKGYSGTLKGPLAVTGGRIVITPAGKSPDKEG